MGSKIKSQGLGEMIDHFKGLQKPPVKTILALEQALASGFIATQAHTHVITSSLKFSGTTTSHFDGDTWEGTVEYGGPSTGVNNPVDYAIYERQRGGEHDFMAPLQQTEIEMSWIIKKVGDGDL